MKEPSFTLDFYRPFIQAFQAMQWDAAAINHKNGFTTDDSLFDGFEHVVRELFSDAGLDIERFESLFGAFRNARTGLKLALIMGELGETLEAVRKNMGPDSHIPDFSSEEAEVADAVIRIMNYASDRKLRLAEAIVAKNEFNCNRADHSKEARAAEHGKRF